MPIYFLIKLNFIPSVVYLVQVRILSILDKYLLICLKHVVSYSAVSTHISGKSEKYIYLYTYKNS